MKIVIQRVSEASVSVEGKTVGRIGKGFMLLIGVAKGDTEQDAVTLAEKIYKLRVFEDENEKMNLSLADVNGGVLAISQFTLCAECRRGNRPDFFNAAPPSEANAIYELFVEEMRKKGITTEMGIFGADMKVSLINDGPVTIILDSEELKKSRHAK
ncbi:MAG: D-tyrosyl-tRNA(Tyr) deacylase [Ruminococcaceae bacterium]|nr:D-tyrosyl-tRNA(Tyr) deacylase [Oscillospiraceae bacterium]